MIHYYVLEDQPIQQRRIQQIIGVCRLFDQPAQLLAALQADEDPKIILLDLDLHTVTDAGLSVAQMIRTFDSMSPIIIVSTHTELLAASYRYQIAALDFIDKSQADGQFQSRLRSALHAATNQLALHAKKTPEMVTLPSIRHHETVDVNEIIYIASNAGASHRVVIHCQQRQIDLRATMKAMAALSEQLIQIHAAYIVNRDKICCLDVKNHTVILQHQIRLPYSKKHFKKLQTLLR